MDIKIWNKDGKHKTKTGYFEVKRYTTWKRWWKMGQSTQIVYGVISDRSTRWFFRDSGGEKLQKKSTLTIIISSVPHRETSEEVRQSPWFCKYLPRFVRAAHWVVRIDQGELSGKWPNTLIDTVQPRQVKQKFPKGTEILQLQQKHFMFAAA